MRDSACHHIPMAGRQEGGRVKSSVPSAWEAGPSGVSSEEGHLVRACLWCPGRMTAKDDGISRET